MEYVFVYGTLKKSGSNHYFLKNSEFVERYIITNHVLYDIGHGFPYMIKGNGAVYGEIYKVDKDTMYSLDRLEGVGSLYNRCAETYFDDKKAVELNYYTSVINKFEKNQLIKTGFWDIKNSEEILNVKVEGRIYKDTADKIVFHMRFFDGHRTPTNKDYMELVKKRSHIELLDTNTEETFVRQCISHGMIQEQH